MATKNLLELEATLCEEAKKLIREASCLGERQAALPRPADYAPLPPVMSRDALVKAVTDIIDRAITFGRENQLEAQRNADELRIGMGWEPLR